MCVETLTTVLIFPRRSIVRNHMPPRRSIWGITCLGVLSKWTFSHLSPYKPHKCVLKFPEQCSFFPRLSIWGVTCLGLLSKCMFSHLSPQKIHKCVLKPHNSAPFSEMIDLRCHMPRFTLKMNIFPSISLQTPNVCWNPQNSARFSKMINLRGHMPRFTLKMNIFPSISLEMPKMCVEILRTVIVFTRWSSLWGVLGLL